MAQQEGFSLDALELQEYQPNRYPFLMIDYVSEVIPGVKAKGYKNLTINEWYFPVHFKDDPNMPGALQLEALAQMLTVALLTLPGLKGKVVHGLKHTVRFKKEVRPGDRLDIETEIIAWRRGICKGRGVGYVNGEIACEAEMMLSIPDMLKGYLPQGEQYHNKQLCAKEIMGCIKNRYPFLMLDAVEEVNNGTYAIGIKRFSNNEYFWRGHFEDSPNVPGAIQLEVMIETFLMTFMTDDKYRGLETTDSQIEHLKFKRKITPGETLRVYAELKDIRRGIAKGDAKGFVGEELACSCEIVVCVPQIMKKYLPGE